MNNNNNNKDNNNNNNNNNNKHNNIIIKIMIINTNTNKRYSTLTISPSYEYYKEHEKTLKVRAIQKICKREGITAKQLLEQGYTKIIATVVSKNR